MTRGRRDEPSGSAPAMAPAPMVSHVSATVAPTRGEVWQAFKDAARGWERPERPTRPTSLPVERERGVRRIVRAGAS